MDIESFKFLDLKMIANTSNYVIVGICDGKEGYGQFSTVNRNKVAFPVHMFDTIEITASPLFAEDDYVSFDLVGY